MPGQDLNTTHVDGGSGWCGSKNGVGGELPEKDSKSAKYQVLTSLRLIIA